MNTVYEGKAAIHVAVIEGYLPIVRLLIHDFNADINMKVLHVHVWQTHTNAQYGYTMYMWLHCTCACMYKDDVNQGFNNAVHHILFCRMKEN